MKVYPNSLPGRLQQCRVVGMSVGLLVLSGLAVAQEKLSLEDLEKLVAEQRIALEEAIANRESTAAQAEELRKDLELVRERSRQVEEEVKALCEEQEALTEGSFDECMTKATN